MPDSRITNAFGINDAGLIVGLYRNSANQLLGYLYSAGTFITIDVPGARFTQALGINDAGSIVGRYVDSRRHGYLYEAGTFTTIDVAGSTETYAYGINSKGQIVGAYVACGVSHGYLYDAGQFRAVDYPGAYETQPFGVNSRGEIVGYWVPAPSAQARGFVATVGPIPDPLPVLIPEPSALLLFLAGLSALTVCVRLRGRPHQLHACIGRRGFSSALVVSSVLSQKFAASISRSC